MQYRWLCSAFVGALFLMSSFFRLVLIFACSLLAFSAQAGFASVDSSESKPLAEVICGFHETGEEAEPTPRATLPPTPQPEPVLKPSVPVSEIAVFFRHDNSSNTAVKPCPLRKPAVGSAGLHIPCDMEAMSWNCCCLKNSEPLATVNGNEGFFLAITPFATEAYTRFDYKNIPNGRISALTGYFQLDPRPPSL